MFRRSWSDGSSRALGERERLVEEPDRGRDARQQVPAHPQPVEHLGAVDVGEAFALDERARLGEQGEPALDVAVLGARHRLAVQRAHAQLGRARPQHGRQRPRVLLDRRVELVLLEQRLGAREDRLGLRAVVGRDAAREEAGVDPQAKREPLDGLRRRARLAPLDLRDVLLREAVAGELGLRQPGGHAQLAQALAEARRTGRSGRCSLVRREESYAGSACRTLDRIAIP